MSFRSIARGAAVASSVVMLSGYVWYRSVGGSQPRVEAPPPAHVAEVQATPVNAVGPDATMFEQSVGSGDLILVDPAFANAEGDPGTAQPKAGYVFSVMTGSKSGEVRFSPPAAPPEQKRTTLFSGSKSERMVLPLPASTEEAAAPAKPPEPERRVLMPGSKSADLLPSSAMPGAIVQSREAPQTSAVQEAPPAPVKKKRRVLMSSSKSKPVEWVEVEDEKTDAPPQQQQEQRRAGEDGQ